MIVKVQNLIIALAVFAVTHQAAAQGTTAFTYQGQLHDSGTNANGTYTMIFKLYDAPSSGNQIGSAITTSTTLANGLFSVTLDFGAGAFDGSARWLDITVTNGPDTQTLPREPFQTTPYAQFASVAATVTNGAIGSSQLAPNLAVSGTFVCTNLQMGPTPWSMSVGSLNGYSGVLTFSSSSGVQMGITPDGSGAGIYGSLQVLSYNSKNNGAITAAGDVKAGNGAVDLAKDGSITASGVVSAQSFTTTSDRNQKEKFAPVNNQEILERVASLPISQWNFKTDAQTRHIGPMAQDFYAAFNVGTDDKHIATVDEDGVALAAIQGLNEKLKDKDAQIKALEKRLADLEQLVRTSTQK